MSALLCKLKPKTNKSNNWLNFKGIQKGRSAPKKKVKQCCEGEPARTERVIWIGNETGRRARLHENKCDSNCPNIGRNSQRCLFAAAA